MFENISLRAGASRSLFSSKISRREVCNVSLGFLFDIFIWNAKMQYRSLWMGKMQSCVSLLSVWFLKKRVFKICVLNGFFNSLSLLWPCSSHDFQCTGLSASWSVGPRSSGITARFLFHERNTASLTFLMVWTYTICVCLQILSYSMFSDEHFSS